MAEPTLLLIHAPGAPGLRWLGLGPGLRPTRGLWKLQRLLDQHAFWAQGRSLGQLRRMLAGSAAVASLWQGKRLVGFGRASSDGAFRAVLWDVVVAGEHQGLGLEQPLDMWLDAATVEGQVMVVAPLLGAEHRIETLRIEVTVVDLVPGIGQPLEKGIENGAAKRDAAGMIEDNENFHMRGSQRGFRKPSNRRRDCPRQSAELGLHHRADFAEIHLAGVFAL